MTITHRLPRLRLARIAAVACAASALAGAASAAPPGAAEVFATMGFSAAEQQRMLSGEFVVGSLPASSDRDLTVTFGFLVKTTPDDLAKRILLRELVTADPQVRAHGELHGDGAATDFAGLTVPPALAQSFRKAAPGDALNLSTDEIAAFRSMPPGDAAVPQQIEAMLLARHRAYAAKGLAGIAPYARSGGKTSDPGADLRSATEAARELAKYLPTVQQDLLRFPERKTAGVEELFAWALYDIEGTPGFVLTHLLMAPDGDARVIVQRQYYVSASYDAEQAVAAFFPTREGTLVAYANHTFTSQVTGFGGTAKKGIGRRMLAKKLQEIFERARTMIAP